MKIIEAINLIDAYHVLLLVTEIWTTKFFFFDNLPEFLSISCIWT